MANSAGFNVFRAPVTSAGSQGTPDTVVLAVVPHGLNSTQLVAQAGTGSGGTSGPVNTPNSGAAMGPTLAASILANSVGFVCQGNPGGNTKIYNPTNGGPMFLGVDATVSPSNGALLPPGLVLTLQTYQGPVWAYNNSAAAASLYFFTETFL